MSKRDTFKFGGARERDSGDELLPERDGWEPSRDRIGPVVQRLGLLREQHARTGSAPEFTRSASSAVREELMKRMIVIFAILALALAVTYAQGPNEVGMCATANLNPGWSTVNLAHRAEPIIGKTKSTWGMGSTTLIFGDTSALVRPKMFSIRL